MKTISSVFFALILLFLSNSCTNGQTTDNTNLSADDFANKIKETPGAIIIDVRTPEEFNGGHITNALNIDWRGNSFDKQIAEIDPSKPVFVYCLSGGRSYAAANKMRQKGFQKVYELDGGIMKWRAAGLAETTNNVAATTDEISSEDFQKFLESDKYVLIDFYAEWCAPCKIMKPYLEELDSTKADVLKVIRIDVEKNKALADKMDIEGLPTLLLYKNKNIVWKKLGLTGKEEIVAQLK